MSRDFLLILFGMAAGLAVIVMTAEASYQATGNYQVKTEWLFDFAN
jgi:hypothetical protein